MQAARPVAPQPSPEKAVAHLAAEVKAVKGVPLRVRIPTSATGLAAHLRNSGGCMVVSRLATDGDAEIVTVFAEGGWRPVETPEPPCSGIPRRVSDPEVNAAFGDPIGRARAAYGPGSFALAVILTPALHDRAEAALVAHFGPISQEEMAQRAAESGYAITCLAGVDGAVGCQ
jgi:hypothetical protein